MPRTSLLWAALALEALAAMWLQSPWLFPDSKAYLALAGGDLSALQVRMPLYGLFLAIVPNHTVAVAIQMGLYLASLALFASLSRSRAIFLGMMAIYVFPFFYSAAILTEALALFFISLTTWLAVKRKSWLLIGLSASCCILVRGDLLLILPALLAVALLQRQWAEAARFAVVVGLMLLPFTIWNGVHYGRYSPIPVRSALGQSLYIASWESTASLKDLKVVSGADATPAAERSGLAAEVASIRARGGSPELYQEAAIRRFEANPRDFVVHSVKALWRLFNTGTYPVPRPVAFMLSLVSGLAWAFGLAGMVWAIVKRETPIVPIVIFLAILLPHLPLHTEARYTAALRPILLFYAAGLLAALEVPTMIRQLWSWVLNRMPPEPGHCRNCGVSSSDAVCPDCIVDLAW